MTNSKRKRVVSTVVGMVLITVSIAFIYYLSNSPGISEDGRRTFSLVMVIITFMFAVASRNALNVVLEQRVYMSKTLTHFANRPHVLV